MAALLTIEAANTDKLAMYLGECRDLGVAGAAARHQREPAALHRRARRACASACARSRTSAKARSCRCSPCAERSGPDRPRCMQLVRRRSTCGWSTSGCSRAWSRPARSTALVPAGRRPPIAGAPRSFARRRPRDRARQPAPARSRARGSVSCSAAAMRRRRRRPRSPLPDAPRRGPRSQQLAFEKEALGLYMSGHPLERFAGRPEGVRRARASRELHRSPRPTSGSAASSAACAR